jgi:tetratricopeptide (TPR) repeat protein
VKVPIETLDRVRALYERGLYCRALEAAKPFEDLRAWEGTEARVLAGRLATMLGASRLGRVLHATAARRDPEDPAARYYATRALLERFGPLAAWRVFRSTPEPPGEPVDAKVDWLCLRALTAALLRDFDRAERDLDAAQHAEPREPWVWVERAKVLELQDRCEEALEAARRSMEMRPWYRPGVQSAAETMRLLGRDDEAAELMAQAAGRIECGYLLLQFAALHEDHGRAREAGRAFEEALRLLPLAEKPLVDWIRARQSDAAYLCGDLARAVELGRASGAHLQRRVADNIEGRPPGARRRVLEVPYVRQHHMTCAPATLASIGRYWGMPAEHLEVAEEICYDGTPAHSERQWAESRGWFVREFTADWDSTVRLLDRGIPYTVTTVEPGSAHLQAVRGYDAIRGTVLIRDPSTPHEVETLAAEFFERYRSVGPRGMAMAPADRSAELRELALPDAELYDLYYRAQRGLVAHDREEAGRAAAELEARAPGHALGLYALWSLAAYDSDPSRALECAERLLALYPDAAHLQMRKLDLLRELDRRAERTALLRKICENPDSQPMFWQMLAADMGPDARQNARTKFLLRSAIRRRPLDAWNFHLLANVLWEERRLEEAFELYRFAVCLEDKVEVHAQDYFSLSRHLGRTEEAIAMLRGRFERFGVKSSAPAMTLFGCLMAADRIPEAFESLESALARRPEDGDLLLFAADAHARAGGFQRAEELIRAAEASCRRTAWLRTRAVLAQYRGEGAEALALWREVAEREPRSVEAHAAIARLVAGASGRTEALRSLRASASRLPHNFALHQLWYEWAREEDAAEAEEALRRMAGIDPDDAWTRRELALRHALAGRAREGFDEIRAALARDPRQPAAHFILGLLFRAAGKPAEARAAFRDAIGLSIDHTGAISALVGECRTHQEQVEALGFVRDQLARQVTFGDGIAAYRQYAQGILPPEELAESLEQVRRERQDLWASW